MQSTFDNFTVQSDGLLGSEGPNGTAEEDMTRQVATFVEMLQAQAGGPRGYRLRRIILTNFWLYGQQEFEIPHGRLFLAGENASGKSTVLTAALPLGLEGDLRPNRLDTFGGRERHIEYYVLGGTESATPFSHERRTAYIALEFEWCDPDSPPIAPELRQRWENGDREKTRFLTIGLSIAGNANATDRIRPLRFLITDGSRLGYDLQTIYETGNKHEKRAYDHVRFRQLLEGHGIICDSQAEYERQVARHLFGFTDEKDFEKLINLLLVLRRPNLSSELNFSRVHDYLKQSLRKISGETTQRVIGTIERIDTIQSEIERIQEAFNAAERLHRARQGLALVRAQLAACEYMGAQLAENAVESRVTKLRKDLLAVDNERKRAEARSQTLQTEQYQINGQISALEASEGLQVAKQLTSVRERAREAAAQMHLQQQSLEAARHSILEYAESLERQRAQFEKIKAESAAHLRELYQVAADECYWETAAFQLEQALQQISAISMEADSQPEVPLNVQALSGELAEERIDWLRHLEELHQQREKLESKVQYARTLETTRFQELDDVRRRFQGVQDRAYTSQQNLVKTLEQFIADASEYAQGEIGVPARGTSTMTTPDDSARAMEEIPQASRLPGSLDDEALSGSIVEQFGATIHSYRQTIEALEQDLIDAADQAQGELNELQLLTGSKNHEIAEISALYEQKLAEPEFTPQHPTRRTVARAKLAERGISALPLYTLLDFAPGINSESDEAGRIEFMLEDAGLLDALVVAPSQTAEADALLTAEGLSDCRLDIKAIRTSNDSARVMVGVPLAGTLGGAATAMGGTDTMAGAATAMGGTDTMAGAAPTMDGDGTMGGAATLPSGLSSVLRFDIAAKEYANDNGTDWEAVTASILPNIGTLTQPGETSAVYAMHADGTWQHGLLTGHAGTGTATCIGKATRLRVRQRELDELDAQRAQLNEELRWLTDRLAGYEQQLQLLQEKQVQLRRVLPGSGMEELYTELAQIQLTLDDARAKYAKARSQAQEARESRNALVAQLERESNGIGALASDPKRVQQALLGVINLKNQARSLRNQLTSIASTWEESHKTGEALAKARINQDNVAHLYERVRSQALQAQAQEEELQRIAEYADAEQLSERLHALRERGETLVIELDEAKATYVRADERANATGDHLTEAEEQLRQIAAERTEKQAHFVDLLDMYPVEELVEVQQLVTGGNCVRGAKKLLGGQVSDGDIPVLKERIEGAYRETYSSLVRTFNHEQPLLLEYGPDLDDAGNVLFLSENKSRPVELLEVLSERIEMQKTLLGEEERKLFEDFLLQEIAEAIRTHILEAEEWVQQINKVLSGLPMIGEHYALQWKQPAEYDLTRLGSHLAQHYRLLRKPAQSLTAEEAETLMSAFRQEIEAVRLRQQENPDMNFMEALEQVFDYREWFHFDVWVTPIGGQRQRLTDRVAGTRSGAEQLFALYVPLFAALGALYRSAAPGAPRLLALDEAFDKVSVANTQRIMEFLVSQDFQWIMTGPQVSGTGAKIPACARYLMIHEKGSPVATASASFWSDSQNLAHGDNQ